MNKTTANTYLEGNTFEVNSGVIRVIDPAFSPPEKYAKLNYHFNVIRNVPIGLWKSIILTETSPIIGEVVKQIRIFHESVEMSIFKDRKHFDWSIATIDSYSGCCGFFDDGKFLEESHLNKNFFNDRIIENLDANQILSKDNDLGVFSRSMSLSEDMAHHSLAVHESKKAMYLEFIDDPEHIRLKQKYMLRHLKNEDYQI